MYAHYNLNVNLVRPTYVCPQPPFYIDVLHSASLRKKY